MHVLDPETLEHKPSYTPDLVRVVKVTEMLPQYDAQSTAIVCNEVPKAIGDLYRLYIVLLYSQETDRHRFIFRQNPGDHDRYAGDLLPAAGRPGRKTSGVFDVVLRLRLSGANLGWKT